MNRTVNVSIGRKPFICDDGAYTVLKEYLQRSRTALKDDPDSEEVLADLELSMAGHLEETSKGQVIDKDTALKVVDLMGEINTEYKDDNQSDSDSASDGSEWQKVKDLFKKPLYKDRSRQVIDGVCSGLARSLDIDPFWVRVVFTLLALVTQGFWVIVYIVLSLSMKEDSGYEKSKKASQVLSDVKEKIDESNILVRIEKILRKVVVISFKTVKVILQITMATLLFVLSAAWLAVIFRLSSNNTIIPLLNEDRGWLEYVFVIGLGLVLIIPLIQVFLGNKGQKLRSISWSSWAIAFIMLVASGINLAPKVHEYIVEVKPNNQFIAATVINDKIEDLCLGYCKPDSVVRVSIESCSDFAHGLTGDMERIDNSNQMRTVQYVSDADREIIQSTWYGWNLVTKTFDTPLSFDTYCDHISSVQKQVGNNVVFINSLPAQGFSMFDAGEGQKNGTFELVYFIRDPDPLKWYEGNL